VKPTTATAAPQITPGLRRFLYATAGITGACVLIVEILGAKMLSPFVGTSHFVWTAQIGVTLVSLACGYYLGGRIADARPKFSLMFTAILIAAVYLCMTLFLVEPIAFATLKYRLALGALLTSAFLFFIPLTCLAMVGPFLIRALVPALHQLGKHAGQISAISTIGSVLGTSLIGYVLLPFMANSTTMLMTAGILASLSIIYFIVWGRNEGKAAPVLLALAGVAFGFLGWANERDRRFASGEELMRVNSNFGLLQVMRSKAAGTLHYLNDYLTQNTYDPQTGKSMSLFTYMLAELPYSYTDKVDDVLCIGMGVGIAPMDFAKRGERVDVVEINPTVVPLAEKYFGLKPEKLNIHIGDGRYFLNKPSKKYDVIALDAFLGDSSPAHLMTIEAFKAMRAALRPGGVLVINSFGDFRTGHDFFMRSLARTLQEAFGHVRVHTSDPHGTSNVFFVASDEPLQMRKEPDYNAMPRYIGHQVRSAYEGLVTIDPGNAPTLTDDFNPVEYYDAANREHHRRSMALSMRPQRGAAE